LLAGEQFPPFERLYRKKDGELLPVEVNIELVRDGNGRPLHFQSVARDITRRKQAEAALKAARDELEQRVEERTAALHSANRSLEKALRSRDEFMAAVSHELRTPLSGILGFSEALQITLNDGLSARQIKAVQHIEASGRRLLELINVVLDYTLIQSGKLQLSLAPCSLTNICQSSLQAVGAKASAKEQLLELNISHPGARLVADERRLHQVVNSLLDNAVKFTPEGGRIGLQVDYLVDEKLVRLSVTDTGIGIHQDDLPRMFQPFVQLDARLSRRYTGAGLSLALARALVELHSGSLAVESSPGQGSSFIMTLPWQEEIQRQV
jgi:signal transduction histidine kinase